MGSIPLLIPIFIFFVLNGSLWAPIQLIFYASTFLFVCHIKIDRTIALLSKQSGFHGNTGLGYLFLILIAISGLYPLVSLSSVVVIGFMASDIHSKRGEVR